METNQKPALNRTWIALLLYTVFSGVLRKWFITGAAAKSAIFAGNLLLPLALLYFSGRDYTGKKTLWVTGIAYLSILTGLAFHPLQVSIYHGFSGILIHALFWTILFVYLNHPQFPIEGRYAFIFIGLCLIETALGSIQYFSPPGSLINRYAEGEGVGVVAMAGASVRVTGTFSYLGGFSSFSSFAAFITCYYIKRKPGSPLILPLLVTGIYNCLISGSRAALLFYLLTITVFLVTEITFTFYRRHIVRLVTSSVILALVNSALLDPFHIQYAVAAGFDSFNTRTLANQDEGINRIISGPLEPFTKKFSFKLAGIGLGATYQGANAAFGRSPLLAGIGYENELFRLVAEGGIVLLLLRFLLLAYVLSFFRFSFFFKLYLFLVIGIYSSFVFNIYGGIFIASGLCLVNQAYPYPRRYEV
ncbi:hypothetical protein [Hufsiella ginkgonis]|uniref:O-antigen ligase domain-containing protein n=1 Tax=Hufsiella ginkgonis TaxID=2695274 RepID=A0A7K1Y3M4_9SPHI|nr:hypothetical protein [Hufsiella ginkgonis]MXV17842.1 hypothetical protein [Hufsiella ginkgonis]